MTGPDTSDANLSSQPPASPVETPAGSTSGWQNPAPSAPVPGAAGFVYADVPNRIIALIIDAIILAIVTTIVTGIVYGIVGQPVEIDLSGQTAGGIRMNVLPVIVGAIISLAISAAYYIYTWTKMRASIGMKVLGMQVGNAADGRTLTQDQAIRRWGVLFAPFSVAQIAYVAPTLGMLVGLATLGYAIYLLWTTAKSPTKQGFHDTFAGSVVVKAARTA